MSEVHKVTPMIPGPVQPPNIELLFNGSTTLDDLAALGWKPRPVTPGPSWEMVHEPSGRVWMLPPWICSMIFTAEWAGEARVRNGIRDILRLGRWHE